MKIHKTIIFKYEPRLISLYFLKNRTILIYAIHLFLGGGVLSGLILFSIGHQHMHYTALLWRGGSQNCKEKCYKIFEGPQIHLDFYISLAFSEILGPFCLASLGLEGIGSN